MFALPFLATALGFALVWILGGSVLPTDEAFARYMAVAVLAGLDTVLGGVRAWLSDTFDDAIFISGFFTNAILAVGLVFLGERLGLETGFSDGRISVMMIGAVVVFTGRILNNLAGLRRIFIENFRSHPKNEGAAPALTAEPRS